MTSVLLVGVGGLGGEFLYALALSDYQVASLCIVDSDLVSLHTCSRHAIFNCRSMIEKPKARLAASWLKERRCNVKVEHFESSIQSFPLSFFQSFNVVICAVDNLETRRFVNCAVVQCNAVHKRELILLEGGTEGWMGHGRMMIPGLTPCLECHIDLYVVDERSFRPVCAGPVDEASVIVTAPFVNTFIAALMLSLLYNKNSGHFIYNATTAYMQKVQLVNNPDCVVCSSSIKKP